MNNDSKKVKTFNSVWYIARRGDDNAGSESLQTSDIAASYLLWGSDVFEKKANLFEKQSVTTTKPFWRKKGFENNTSRIRYFFWVKSADLLNNQAKTRPQET